MEQKRGLGDIYADESDYNATEQQINKAFNKLNTAWIGRIVSCKSDGVNGSKTVVAVPVVATVDGQGNQQGAVNYVELPHYRVNAGVCGVIIDPQPGDLGVFVVCKKNISKAPQGGTQTPGSFRQFNMADSIMIATIHTSAPTVYIHLKQDGNIDITAPTAVTVKAPTVNVNAESAYNLTAPQINIKGTVQVQGTITSSGNVTGAGISLNSHRHTGVQAGGSNTGGPV